MQRKLERSRTNSRLAGVCGGLGEYLDVDPTLIRLAFILLALYGGHGILLYIILMLVMPPQGDAVATPPKAE
jgi:phage shock protein PspC (stress-responsive transcriptional regulator)